MKGGGMEGGRNKPHSLAAERRRRSHGGGSNGLNGSDCDREHDSDPRPW